MKTFIDFVFEKHAGQIRKATGMPYYSHLAEVAGFTSMFVPGARAACVAWGHDLFEDTDATHDQVARALYDAGVDSCSAIVADIVSLSDNNDQGATRKQKHGSAMIRVSKASIIAQNVKCADVCSNAGSLHLLPYSPWVDTYLDEKFDTLEYCDKANPELRRIGFALIRRARELVQQITLP